MQYIRKQYNTIVERIKEPRKTIQVIAGPRQVGKSTIMEQVCANLDMPVFMYNADAVLHTDIHWINQTWESVRMTMTLRQLPEALLVIDEVQKLDQWSEAVKREWDADTRNKINIKVVLLGSSRLMLRKGLTESLAGRFEIIRMGHWSYSEMRDAFGFTLEQWIYYGGYPGAVPYINNMTRWRKYVNDSLIAPSIEKDVIMTSRIFKPALMKQLFELGCSYSSEILSLTKVLGQLQDAGNVTTLSGYLDILDQSNMLTSLHKYARDEARKRQSVPKFQVYNNALLTAFNGKDLIQDATNPKLWGRWVESAVGVHLLDCARETGCSLYYWRNRDDEVDFILEYHGNAIAIEVKSGRRGMNRGIPIFTQKYHPKRSIVVGTDGIPLSDFLQIDGEQLFNLLLK